MRGCFVILRSIAALTVVVMLFAAPIAAAQTPEAAPSSAAPPRPALLSPAAFTRLVQASRADEAPVPVVAEPARPSLLRQSTAAGAHEARAIAGPAPQQSSWVSRHKVAVFWIIAGGVFLTWVGHYFWVLTS